jgi:hypothetical protein
MDKEEFRNLAYLVVSLVFGVPVLAALFVIIIETIKRLLKEVWKWIIGKS